MISDLRILLSTMLEKVPVDHVKRTFEFVPGGDLRSSQNSWLRSAWERSELKKVPREKQFRLILLKICQKKTNPFLGTRFR